MCLQNAFSMLLLPDLPTAPTLQILASQLQWEGSGVYAARNLSITTAGNYTLSVQHNFSSVAGSPFWLTLLPGPANASRSLVGGSGWQGPLIAGVLARVELQALDTWGNAAHSSTDRFWLGVNDGSRGGAGLRVVQFASVGEEGRYLATYAVAHAGNMSVSLHVWLDTAQVG